MSEKRKMVCGKCGSKGFYALEQVQARYYCEFDEYDGILTISQSAKGEFIRDMATSVTIAYICTMCEFTVGPDQILTALKEAE